MINKKFYHLIFFSIILINYLFPLIIFGKVTTFYHDNLDSLVVYNSIIGKIYSGELINADIFLNGNIEAFYLRHFFKPFLIFYVIFNTELAYFVTDFLVKLTCYISFFVLAKKINKNIFICCLTSAIYACLNFYTNLGFGCAILPYLVYLIVYKERIYLKHYLILVFFGLNADLIAEIFFIPIIICILFILDKNLLTKKLGQIFKVLGIFFFFTILSSSNIIYLQIFGEQMHREEFSSNGLPFFENLISQILAVFRIPTGLNWTFFYNFPYAILYLPLISIAFFSKNEKAIKFLFLIIFIHIFSFVLNTEAFSYFKNNSFGLAKTIKFNWIEIYLPVLHTFLFLFLISSSKIKSFKFLVFFSCISIFSFQLSASGVPILKKFIFKENNYRNLYTFDGYYSYKQYQKIKEVVRTSRVLSVGLDPMVAVINGIKVIDGYHALYPLKYKKEFRKIIEKELDADNITEKYYDNWGSRVYAFVKNPNKVLINFKEAQNIGADFVISKFPIVSEDLKLECKNCSLNIFLYKIE